MALTVEEIKDFVNQDDELLKNVLIQQFQSHFNALQETIPNIKTIEWTAAQEDEMLFSLIHFSIEKNNGYIFKNSYSSYCSDNEKLSSIEFTEKEIKLIEQFQDYLDASSHLIVLLWGTNNFRLDAK